MQRTSAEPKRAPWTYAEVEALNEWQANDALHPYTCGSGKRHDEAHRIMRAVRDDKDDGVLIATRDGWHCPACSYTQDWAWL